MQEAPLHSVPLEERRGGISATTLRLLAMVFMLLDHTWATVVPGNNWMTCVGRLAFPIFAFQIAEGYLHTSNCRRYVKRLLVTALIAEIPFDLMSTGAPIFPFHQNTIFTLLLGIWAVSALERARRERSVGGWLRCAGILLLACLVSVIGMTDYGWKGVLTVVAFYLLRDFRGARLCQLAAMVVLHSLLAEGLMLEVFGFSIAQQSLAVLALIPIWLYNGQKGRGGKVFQYAAYVFYPVHLLLLYVLYHLIY